MVYSLTRSFFPIWKLLLFVLARALELFLQHIMLSSAEITSAKDAKTLTSQHILEVITKDQRLSFLREAAFKSCSMANGNGNGNSGNQNEYIIRFLLFCELFRVNWTRKFNIFKHYYWFLMLLFYEFKTEYLYFIRYLIFSCSKCSENRTF